MGLFTRFRSEEAARAAVGQLVKTEGQSWICVGHNDLGCLYWRKFRASGPFGRTYTVPAADADLERGKTINVGA